MTAQSPSAQHPTWVRLSTNRSRLAPAGIPMHVPGMSLRANRGGRVLRRPNLYARPLSSARALTDTMGLIR
jgi:hypothetical protein